MNCFDMNAYTFLLIFLINDQKTSQKKLVSLISQKYGKINTKEYLAKKKDIGYNEDEVQKSQIPSGLCG